MKYFTGETLLEIRDWLVTQLCEAAVGAVDFGVPDPALGPGLYSGEELRVGLRVARHRGYRCWTELAELLGCRMVLPRAAESATVATDSTQAEGNTVEHDREWFVRLRFEKLDREGSFHD